MRLERKSDEKGQITSAPLPLARENTSSRDANDYHRREFKAGQLLQYIGNWEKLRAPPQLISIISGYSLPFNSRPPLRRIQDSIPPPLVTSLSGNMAIVVTDMLEKGIVVKTR
uniref:Uncharacterized protein n=1 Tax=Cacopsylla melanoneura TaxID=428564 RepID=A0A8D8RFT5_9HEMI